MGTGIHAVMQKQNDEGKFITIDTDVLDFGSSIAREFMVYTSTAGHKGFPTVDFDIIESNYIVYHEGFYMGEHSFQTIPLDRFMTIQLDFPDSCRVTRSSQGKYYIEVDTSGEEDGITRVIKALQDAYSLMYGSSNIHRYRLVVGYDS